MLRAVAYVLIASWGVLALLVVARMVVVLGRRVHLALAAARARLELDDRRVARTLDAWTMEATGR